MNFTVGICLKWINQGLRKAIYSSRLIRLKVLGQSFLKRLDFPIQKLQG